MKSNMMSKVLLSILVLLSASCGEEEKVFDFPIRPEPTVEVHIPMNKEDSLAMVAFYHSMKCAEWEPGYHWDITDYDTWGGCTVELGVDGEYHIVKIKLVEPKYFPAGYSLPSEIGNMRSLRSLVLFGDKRATGGIPKELFNCPLEELYFAGEGFTGTIPKEIGKVGKTLRWCRISNSLIGGEIPEEITQLQHPDLYLSLISNQFKGKVPIFMGRLPNVCDLSYNYFTEMDWRYFTEKDGNVPCMHRNCLSGEIPQEVLLSPKWKEWRWTITGQREGYGYDESYFDKNK